MKRLTPSLLALCVNLPFALSGLPLGSFDAYTHIFFADHYRRLWFDLYEARWFGGFSVASYPPLVHQLIALLSMPASAFASLAGGAPQEIRFRGEAVGYCTLLVIVLACLPVAVERFARIFVPARAARAASWLSVGLPSVYLTAYSFGQLPTLAASTALLWALAQAWQYSRTGQWRDLLAAILWAGVTASAHHAVLLFAAFAGSAVVVRALQRTASDSAELTALQKTLRLGLWLVLSVAFGALVIWPFLAWSRSYVPQTPIDHASRHNLFTDWLAGYYFFWPMYGPFLVVLPVSVLSILIRPQHRSAGFCASTPKYDGLERGRRPTLPSRTRTSLFRDGLIRRVRSLRSLEWNLLWRRRRHWPLLAIALTLFVLGLGGTTPLPRLLFGMSWEWLTYDRFSLWAGLTLLPFAGLLYHLFRSRFAVRTVALALLTIPFCVFGAFAIRWVHGQPAAVDVETIARFLNKHAGNGERYLTLGLGDQFARLSVLTEARTIDGEYFTGRQVPELRYSGLGTLDGAIWNPAGADSLVPFLKRAYRWGVRWAFVAHSVYERPLARSGWEYFGEIVPGVALWRNRAAWVSTEWQMPVVTDPGAASWWGLAPLATLAIALLTILARSVPRSLRFFVGSLIVVWPFWYNVVVWDKPYAGVYFLYTSGAVFVADVIAAMLVAFVLVWIQRRGDTEFTRQRLPALLLSSPLASLNLAFVCVVIAAFVSIPGSTDRWLSLTFALHLCAMGFITWAIARATREMDWFALAMPLTVGAMIQSVVGVIEVAVQNTTWLSSMNMTWPGSLSAVTHGASVVGLADGTRWLRAYGTLPHPNILGGYLIVTLAGPLLGYIHTGKRRWLAPLALCAATIFLTFSRAAWLALAVLLIGLILLLPQAARRRGAVIMSCVAGVGVVLAAVFAPLAWVRITASTSSPFEISSAVERLELARWALAFIRQRPLTGVGAAAFGPAMVSSGAPGAEPVHNVPLLAAAETGLGGGAGVVALGLAVLWVAWKRRGVSALESTIAACVLGLLVIAMFDHFLWSIALGRLWAALVAGLFGGAFGRSPPHAGTNDVAQDRPSPNLKP